MRAHSGVERAQLGEMKRGGRMRAHRPHARGRRHTHFTRTETDLVDYVVVLRAVGGLGFLFAEILFSAWEVGHLANNALGGVLSERLSWEIS